MASKCFNLWISKFYTKLFHKSSPSAHLPWQRHAIWSRFYLVTGQLMWRWCLFSIKECEWHIRLSPGDEKAHSGTDAIEGDSVHAATEWSGHLEGTLRHPGEHAFHWNLNWGEQELRHCPLLHRQRDSQSVRMTPMPVTLHHICDRGVCFAWNSESWTNIKQETRVLVISHTPGTQGMNLTCPCRSDDNLWSGIWPWWGAQTNGSYLSTQAPVWGHVPSAAGTPPKV